MKLRATVYVIAADGTPRVRGVVEIDAANAAHYRIAVDHHVRAGALTDYRFTLAEAERLEFGPIAPPWERVS